MEEQPQARTFMTFSYPLAGAASAGKTCQYASAMDPKPSARSSNNGHD